MTEGKELQRHPVVGATRDDWPSTIKFKWCCGRACRCGPTDLRGKNAMACGKSEMVSSKNVLQIKKSKKKNKAPNLCFCVHSRTVFRVIPASSWQCTPRPLLCSSHKCMNLRTCTDRDHSEIVIPCWHVCTLPWLKMRWESTFTDTRAHQTSRNVGHQSGARLLCQSLETQRPLCPISWMAKRRILYPRSVDRRSSDNHMLEVLNADNQKLMALVRTWQATDLGDSGIPPSPPECPFSKTNSRTNGHSG